MQSLRRDLDASRAELAASRDAVLGFERAVAETASQLLSIKSRVMSSCDAVRSRLAQPPHELLRPIAAAVPMSLSATARLVVSPDPESEGDMVMRGLPMDALQRSAVAVRMATDELCSLQAHQSEYVSLLEREIVRSAVVKEAPAAAAAPESPQLSQVRNKPRFVVSRVAVCLMLDLATEGGACDATKQDGGCKRGHESSTESGACTAVPLAEQTRRCFASSKID
jgi:hypothetical protein